MNNSACWRVISDFDGTISLKDTTDQLLETFAHPSWHEIEQEWVAGAIGSAECMRRQVELVRVSKAELDAWIDSIKIDPAFVDFVHLCQQHHINLSIASDGIDYVIRRVLAKHHLSHIHVTANQLVFLDDGRYTLAPYHTTGVCARGAGVCKCSLAELNRHAGEQILYIGDGRSDFCVSQRVDMVLAKASLLTFCEQHHLPYLAYCDFYDAKEALHRLMTHAPQPQPAILSEYQDEHRVAAA